MVDVNDKLEEATIIKTVFRLLIVACFAISVEQANKNVYAGSEVWGETSAALDDYIKLKRCMDEERSARSHKYTRCSSENKQRQDVRLERKEAIRLQEEEERRELQDLARMPHAVQEMQARFGQVITFDECMSVYDEREIYSKRGITRSDAKGWCVDVVNRVRNYCANTGDRHCADKGFQAEVGGSSR